LNNYSNNKAIQQVYNPMNFLSKILEFCLPDQSNQEDSIHLLWEKEKEIFSGKSLLRIQKNDNQL